MPIKITWMRQEYDVVLHESRYQQNDRLAIEAFCGSERFGVITTNLTNEELADGEFFVRIHSEGEWVKQLLAAGVFEGTGRTVAIGFVEVPVWRRGPRYNEMLKRHC